MSERTVELDEPVMDEQSQALQNAVERAERAEAELAKLQRQASHSGKPAAEHAHKSHTSEGGHKSESGYKSGSGHKSENAHKSDNSASSVKAAEERAPRDTSSTVKPDATGEHLVEPGSMDRTKQPAAQSPEGHAVGDLEERGIEALREDSMMKHLLDSLEEGKDIGHYGRLTFTMIARHFLSDDEVLAELTKDRDFSEEQAKQMLVQVEGRDYSPPRRDRIMQWQAEQEFPIIPNQHDPDCGNVYKSLRFPKQTYDHIGHYQEEKASS